MEHQMRLFEEPFDSIKSGRKTVEVRLYDEKRRRIKAGDTIKFTKIPNDNETLTVEVVGLRLFPTFKEMYENIPAREFDAAESSLDEMVESTYEIYAPEEEKKWGAVAIEIKLFGNG